SCSSAASRRRGRRPPASRSQSPPGGRIGASGRVASCRASSVSAAPLTHEKVNVKHEINSVYRESVSCAHAAGRRGFAPHRPKDGTLDDFFPPCGNEQFSGGKHEWATA